MSAGNGQDASWDDPYLIAVASQLDWWLQTSWRDLEAQGPGLKWGYLRECLDRLEAAGVSTAVELERVQLGDADPASLAAELGELRARVRRVRAAGARAYAQPWRPELELACTAPWPLQHSEVPPDDDPWLDRVMLLDLSDPPQDRPNWAQRARVVRLRNLESLTLQGNRIGAGPIGIDLGALPRLRILDLERNALGYLPPEVLACRGLQALELSANPGLGAGLDIAALTTWLPTLRLLDLRDTGLTRPRLAALRRRLPGCRIEA